MITKDILYQTKAFKDFFEGQSNILDTFLKYINENQDVNQKLFLDFMIQNYIDNCGVSKGKRTVIWDVAWHYLSKNKELWIKKNRETTMNEYFRHHFPVQFEECREYDISILCKNDYLEIGMRMVLEDDILEEYIPFFCNTLYCFIVQFDE